MQQTYPKPPLPRFEIDQIPAREWIPNVPGTPPPWEPAPETPITPPWRFFWTVVAIGTTLLAIGAWLLLFCTL